MMVLPNALSGSQILKIDLRKGGNFKETFFYAACRSGKTT